ncbi:MAG TPA: aminoglycoside phosphotransferase family protein [Firmicutes bacterium]|nr:aminoglycoside phosphotransferase family protein [Bacillota bacterium]
MSREPAKWRETMDPFTLRFNDFKLKEILGYPHAGNDVFHVLVKDKSGALLRAFLKVARQKTADTAREVTVIKRLQFPFLLKILDYSLEPPRYLLTKEAKGERLSTLVGENSDLAPLSYMEAYGELLAKIHSVKMASLPVKARDFNLPSCFFQANDLEHVESYLKDTIVQDTKCFIHGDCHYPNILWQENEVSCLLDFELAGHGSREYDLAWAMVLRPGQKFLKTEKERKAILTSYGKYHDFSKQALNYYFVLFAVFFYHLSPGEENKAYRKFLLDFINDLTAAA